jgi:hypothetical protein
MTLPEFSNIFAVLAVQLQYTQADAVAIRAYYKTLADLEIEFVQAAADRMAQQGGVQIIKPGESPYWFPKAPEWRALAQKIERERQETLRAQLRHRAEPLCLVCDDTGWQPVAPGGVQRCACQKLRRLEVLGRRPMPGQLASGRDEIA